MVAEKGQQSSARGLPVIDEEQSYHSSAESPPSTLSTVSLSPLPQTINFRRRKSKMNDEARAAYNSLVTLINEHLELEKPEHRHRIANRLYIDLQHCIECRDEGLELSDFTMPTKQHKELNCYQKFLEAFPFDQASQHLHAMVRSHKYVKKLESRLEFLSSKPQASKPAFIELAQRNASNSTPSTVTMPPDFALTGVNDSESVRL